MKKKLKIEVDKILTEMDKSLESTQKVIDKLIKIKNHEN